MVNITHKIDGKKLMIEIDLSKSFGASGSGKSEIVASTQGNIDLGVDGIKLGINCYKARKL
jgi:hypothetical protein